MSSLESKMTANNLKGIELEKKGDIREAVALYEYNVSHRFQGNHPYDRLAIIYRKQKRYADEIRVLTTAIDVFNNDVYKERKDRIPKLQKLITRLKTAQRIQEEEKRR